MAAKKTRKKHSKKHSNPAVRRGHARKGHARKKSHKKRAKKSRKKTTSRASKKKAKVITITAKTIMKRVCRSKHVPVSLRKYC